MKPNITKIGTTSIPVLFGNRFLTFNTVVRVNQIEVSRDRSEGVDEADIHTPEANAKEFV
ncbi:MAG: hypothetical protein ABIH42_02375 [Planctomycetota bacterium]